MANRIEFTAGVKVDKADLANLKQELRSIQNMSAQQLVDIGKSNSLADAKKQLVDIKASALSVEKALNQAFSVELGTVNLSKFKNALDKLDVKKISQDLDKAGAAGASAFRNMATQVLTTNVQLKESFSLLQKMGETMANTIRWGIASSAMNAFTGETQKAFNYVKNLDKSLTNIRIVSGQSAEQMKEFAVQANRSAKALGSSTKAYADAALIYYQQGLDGKAASERADITLKMANVTGDSAEEVSSYMTAIWNNFAKGSEQLERYADVMTALGAATASSTDEIAAGLEKFAAIADTVGLSYDYATAALATVTATTRQSADTVGTAFKTLFARIQDLELGKTLDDGTTLGKYSQALAKVGIAIKDSNGELRNMDDILADMGSKWDTLNKDQQVALAQNVAGVRQYAQLVALMDNWDFMQENLRTAANATGELNKQQSIYLESTEAHLDQLQTSAERVYSALIDSDGLNDLIDVASKLTTGLANYIEGIGGAGAAFAQLGGIAMKALGPSLSKAIAKSVTNMTILKNNAKQVKAQFELLEKFKGVEINNKALNTILEMKEATKDYIDIMDQEQMEEAHNYMLRQNELQNQIEMFEQAQGAAEEFYKSLTGEEIDFSGGAEEALKKLNLSSTNMESGLGKAKISLSKILAGKEDASDLDSYFDEAQKAIEANISLVSDELKLKLKKAQVNIKDIIGISNIDELNDEQFQSLEEFNDVYSEFADEIINKAEKTAKTIKKVVAGEGEALKDAAENNAKEFKTTFLENIKIQDLAQTGADIASELMMVSSAINSITGIPDIWGNQNLSTGEKILQTIMAVGNAMNGLSQGLSLINNITDGYKKLIALIPTKAVEEVTANETAIKSETKVQGAIDVTDRKLKDKAVSTALTGVAAKEAFIEMKDNEDKTQEEIEESIAAYARKAIAARGGKISKEEKIVFRDMVKPHANDLSTGLFQSKGYDIKNSSKIPSFHDPEKIMKEYGVTESMAHDLKNVMRIITAQATDMALGLKPETEGFTFKNAKYEKALSDFAPIFNKKEGERKKYASKLLQDVADSSPRQEGADKESVAQVIQDTLEEKLEEKVLNKGASKIAEKTVGKAVGDKATGGILKQFGSKVFGKQIASGTKALGTLKAGALKAGAAVKAAGAAGVAMGATVAIGAAAAVAAIYLVVKAWNKDADAAKAAAKQAENATNIAADLRQQYEELSASFEKYDTLIDKMKTLNESTEEYADTLREANKEAANMIKNSPELAKYYTRDSSGLITFQGENGEDLEDIVEAAKNKADQAEMAANVAQVRANRLQLKSDRTNMTRSISFKATDLYHERGDATYESSAVDYNFLSDDQLQDVLSHINLNGGEILSKDMLREVTSLDDEDLVDALWNNKESVEDLARKTQELNDTNKLLIDETLQNDLSDIAEYRQLSTAGQNAVLSAYSTGLTDEKLDEMYKDAYEEIYTDKAFGGGNEDEVQQNYAKAANLTLVKDKIGDKAVYRNEQGNEFTVSDEDAAAYLASLEVSKRTAEYDTKKRDNIISAIDKISKNTQGLDKDLQEDLLNFAGKTKGAKFDTEELTQKEIDAFEEYMKSAEFKNSLSSVTKEEWKALGYSSADAYIKELQRGIDNYEPDFAGQAERFEKEMKQSQEVLTILSKEDDESKLSEEQIAYLEKLEDEYEELGAIQDRTSHEYLENLRRIKEQQEINRMEALEGQRGELAAEVAEQEKALKKLQEEYNNADDSKKKSLEVKITAKTEELEKTLKELEDTKIEIKAQIDADLQTDVDDAFGLAEEFANLQELIPENLELTFDEAQEISRKGYGAILENAEETSNNTIKLNKATANAYIDGKQAELEADKRTKITQLENEKTMLQQQKNILQSKLQAIEAGLSAETKEKKVAAIADAVLKENEYQIAVQEMNDELQKNSEKNVALTEDEKSAYDAISKMSGEAYDQADTNANKYANNAITYLGGLWNRVTGLARAIKAMFTGETVTINGGGTSKKGVGSGGVKNTYSSKDTVLNDVKNYTQNLSTSEIDKILSQMKKDTNAAISNITNQIGNIDSGIAALKSAGSSLDKAQAGAGKGSGKESDKDLLEDERDIYHDINVEIALIDKNLEKLSKAQEKAFGKDLVKNLVEQISDLDQQMINYTEKLQIAAIESSSLRQQLEAQGATFHYDNTISNYSALYESKLNEVNSVIARYNSMSEEDKKNYESTVEQAEAEFKSLVSLIDRYDELITDMIPGIEANIQDAVSQQIELKITRFNLGIEIGLELADAEEEWAEFKKNIIDDIDEDDILGIATSNLSRISTYFNDANNGIVQVETQKLNDILKELAIMESGAASEIYGSYQDGYKLALEDLKNYYTEAMGHMENLDEIITDIKNSMVEIMEHVSDEMEKQLDAYKFISDTLDHDMALIKLISGEQSYLELDNYFRQKEQNLNSQLDFQRQQVELWQQQMETLEEGSEAWEAAKENWTSAVNNWQSSVKDAIENLQNEYANAIQVIFANINNELTKGKGLEYINQEWELINKNAEEYLDTINAQYGIQTLQNKYLKSIEETDSLSAQKKLRDLMNEQVEALEAQDKLSEYDLKRAELKYQIALKQIALEEAQQSKTSMRLRRDSQGNYSYQYTSDNEQTAALEDELSKLYNDLYNLDKGQYTNNLDTIYNLWTEYQEKMAEAAKINDPEARLEREKLLTEYYGELLNNLALDNTDIRTNLSESAFMEIQELFDESYANQEDLVMNQMVPLWDSGIQEMINLFAGEGGFEQVCTEAYGQIEQAANTYESSLKTLLETAGITYEKIKEGQDKVIVSANTLIKDNKTLMDTYNQEINSIKGVIDSLSQLSVKYKESEAAAKAATEAAAKYWAEQQRQAQAEAAKKVEAEKKPDKVANNSVGGGGNSGSGAGGGSGSGPQGNGTPDVGDMVTYTGGYYYGDSYGGGGKGKRGVGKRVQVTRINNGAPYPIHVYSKDSAYGWLKKEQLSGFDTGGYTGSWNTKDGRLALLHQKELVLNATDTENMLNAVNALRNITDSMGAMMLGRLANITAPGVGNIEDGTLEQNVHIDASFPNVTSSQEIENALNNLVNAATQYIHSKK